MVHKHSKALCLLMLLTAVALFGPSSAFADSCRHLEIYSTYFEDGKEYYQQGSGSVFRWKEDAKNYILTSAHVVAGASRVRAICDGESLELRPLGRVNQHDLAVLVPMTNESKLKPLYELPQAPLKGGGWTVLMNTFFFDYKKPADFPFILNDKQYVNSKFGLLYLKSGFAMWGKKSAETFYRFSASSSWHPFWQVQEDAGFIRFGIQPGMSGSAVVQLQKPEEVSDENQSLVGVVSRSQYLSGISAFVGYKTVNQDLNVLMGKEQPADANMSQWFEFKNGQFHQSLIIRESGSIWTLSDVCSSASDFAMTSVIQRKKMSSKELTRGGGADWGEGGGGAISKSKNYFMDPFLMVTVMVPQENCAAKGVKVNDKFIYLFRGQPINSIDDLLEVKRNNPGLSYTQIITEGFSRKTHKEAWCSVEFPAEQTRVTELTFVNPLPDEQGQPTRPNIEAPANSARFNVACPKDDEAALRFKNHEIKIDLSIKNREKNYSLKVGNCEESGVLPAGNPLTTLIQTGFGKIAITRSSLKSWKIQMNEMAACGLSKPLPTTLIYEIFLKDEK